MERIPLPKTADPLAGVAVSIWKKFFFPLWDYIKDRNLIEDWRQEVAFIALEANRKSLRYGQKELPSFAYQRWYQFLKLYGFKKGKDGKWRADIPILYTGEDFLEKVKEFFPDDIEVQKDPRSESSLAYQEGQKKYYFTIHFLKRWKERIPLQFSPRAVLQQLALGKEVFRLILGNRAIKKRVKCPWFTVVVLEKRNGATVFLTVFIEN